MTYEAIRAELDAINARIASLKAPHFANYGDDRQQEFLADYAEYDEAMRAVVAEARGKGFIRIFNGSFKLNPSQVALAA